MDQNQQQAQTQAFTQNLDSLFTNLEEFTKKESVLGKPVTYGNKTLVPVVSVTLGYGSGKSNTTNQATTTSMNTGPMMGLGARISTEAVVVIDNDNVMMLPVNEKTNTNQLMDKLPQMLSSVMPNQQGQQGQQQGQQAQQAQQDQQGQQQ